jgi:hypothetical protein
MLPQGVLGFQYEPQRSRGGLASLAGLPLYLDLVHRSGLAGCWCTWRIEGEMTPA